MRKSLLVLISLFSISLSAQTDMIKKVATFDFHTLVGDTVKNNKGEVIRVDNIRTAFLEPTAYFGLESVWPLDGGNFSFVSDGVTFYAKRGRTSLSNVLNHNIKPGWCGLQLTGGSCITITVPEDCSLDSIDMCSMGYYDNTGGIIVDESTKYGVIRFGFWRALSTEGEPLKDIHTMTLLNYSGKDAVMSGIKVHYTSPADVLEYTAISPAIDEETDPFTGYELTFAEDITLTEGAEFVVKDADENTVAVLAAKVEGKVLTLTPEAPITKPGTYTLSVSRGALITKIGEYNKAFTATFSVKDHPDTFQYTTITVDTGKVKTLPQQIVMTFPSAIATAMESVDLLNADSEIVKTATVTIHSEDATQLILAFDAEITEVGTYTMSFAENTIQAADEFHYNKAFTLAYQVVGFDVPSAELIARADELLAMTGVGFPKTSSAARAALEGVVNNDNSTLQDYETAISDFISTTDVTLPDYNEYYTIAKVASLDAAERSYIGYSEEALTSTTVEAEAHHFLFVYVEGDRCIQLADGTQKKIDLSKTVNVDAPESVFGLMDVTIEDFSDESKGAGYVLTQVLSPDPVYNVVITPADDKLDVLTEITVTIPEATAITYNSELPVQMLCKDEPEDIITSVKVSGNTLTINIKLQRNDTYTLSIPKGAISFYSIDHDVIVDAITATYDVSRRYGLQYDLTSVYSVYNTLDTDAAHKSEEMNTLGFYCIDTELFINPEHCVSYLQTIEGRNLFTGTLTKSTVVWANETRSTLSFDFGTELNETNLPNGTYVFGVEMGSFGDSFYGEYLANPTPANKPLSHVNYVLSFTYNIDNTETGINDLRSNGTSTETYDIFGRRVTSPVKSGIYIIDGKKVLVK